MNKELVLEDPAGQRSFARVAGILAILSAVPALASLFVALPAAGYDMAVLTDMMLFLRTGARGAGPGRLAMLLDMFGYYLMIAPATMLLGQSLTRRGGDLWVELSTRCVLVYVVVGAVGAAVLAAVLPQLMTAYGSAVGGERATIEVVYRAITDTVYGGLWNVFEEIVAGVGWFGLGWFTRARRPRLGVMTMVLALGCLADGFGNVVGAKAVADVGLYVYLLLAPAWAVWVGVVQLGATRPPTQPLPSSHSFIAFCRRSKSARSASSGARSPSRKLMRAAGYASASAASITS